MAWQSVADSADRPSGLLQLAVMPSLRSLSCVCALSDKEEQTGESRGKREEREQREIEREQEGKKIEREERKKRGKEEEERKKRKKEEMWGKKETGEG